MVREITVVHWIAQLLMLITGNHHISIVHLRIQLVKSNFLVRVVHEICRVLDIFFEMIILIVLNAMKIVLLMFVKNVDERSAPIRKIFRIKIDIGTRNVSFVQCAKLHSLTNHSDVKMINYFVANAIINNLHHVVINANKSLNQVGDEFSFVRRKKRSNSIN